MSPIYLWIAVVEQMSMTRRAPVLQRRGGSLLRKVGNGSHWHHASNQVFISNSAASPNTMRKAGMPGPPSSYPLAQIPWLMGIAGPGLTPSQRGRGMRQEGLCLLRLPPAFATADCQWQHLAGGGPPPKRTLSKENNMRSLEVGRAGRGTRSRGEAEMVLSVSDVCVVV